MQRDVAQHLTIAGIKTEAWFAGTDWDGVCTRAAMDTPRENVARLLQEQGFEHTFWKTVGRRRMRGGSGWRRCKGTRTLRSALQLRSRSR